MTTVDDVTAYDDLDTPRAMRHDAHLAGRRLPTPAQVATGSDAVTDVYAAWPQDRPKQQITVSEAARRLADALELHLD